MRLYYLQAANKEDVDYDELRAAIVAAESAVEARELMSQLCLRFEPPERWTDQTRSTCEFIGTAAPQIVVGVVLTDRKAG